MKSAITICLVPEARSGPFVFHDGLVAGCAAAAELGFDAIEIFPASGDSFPRDEVRSLLVKHGLALAAVGTGAGWLVHKLHLCHPEGAIRTQAREFIRGVIRVAGEFAAPAILGSMQGRVEAGVTREQAIAWLGEALVDLAETAASFGQPLLYEPLNRYETNLFNRQGDAADFVRGLPTRNVRLLCDLFHMNIEEADLAAALEQAGETIGHVHWADSNRRAVGFGHTAPRPIIAALQTAGYDGYLSAEIFPLPDARAAAAQSIASFRYFTETR